MGISQFENYVTDLTDFEALILGKKLGFGIHRDVYEFYFDDTKVIKIANCLRGRANNQIEYRIWDDLCNSKYKKHFAQCFGVSPNGKYLIQEKIKFKDAKKYPKKVPHFFSDIKVDNYGWNNKGKFVCCDYSLTVITNGMTDKMKTVKWENLD